MHTITEDLRPEDELFAKEILSNVLTHFKKKYEFNIDSVMMEIYQDLYPSKS